MSTDRNPLAIVAGDVVRTSIRRLFDPRDRKSDADAKKLVELSSDYRCLAARSITHNERPALVFVTDMNASAYCLDVHFNDTPCGYGCRQWIVQDLIGVPAIMTGALPMAVKYGCPKSTDDALIEVASLLWKVGEASIRHDLAIPPVDAVTCGTEGKNCLSKRSDLGNIVQHRFEDSTLEYMNAVFDCRFC